MVSEFITPGGYYSLEESLKKNWSKKKTKIVVPFLEKIILTTFD